MILSPLLKVAVLSLPGAGSVGVIGEEGVWGCKGEGGKA